MQPGRHAWRSSSQKRPWCDASTTTTSTADTRSARSCDTLNAEQIPTPTGKTEWWHSTLCRILSNEAYVGRRLLQPDRDRPDQHRRQRGRRRGTTQRRRPREEWIEIPCPPILDDAIFEAAQRVSRDNSKWSPRNLHDEAWLLRGLVRCGTATPASTPTSWAATPTRSTATTPAATRLAAASPASNCARSAACAPTCSTPSSSNRSRRPCSAPRCSAPARRRCAPRTVNRR